MDVENKKIKDEVILVATITDVVIEEDYVCFEINTNNIVDNIEFQNIAEAIVNYLSK